jgi:hypothetical protein
MRNIILCAVISAVSASAFADNSQTITLSVKDSPSTGSDGYTDTTASNGEVYSYKYAGGGGDGGDVTFKTGKPATVVLQLNGARRYAIDDISFPRDPNNQLTKVLNPSAPTNAVIQDKNDAAQTATYKVTVEDSTGGATIPCDPQIINN